MWVSFTTQMPGQLDAYRGKTPPSLTMCLFQLKNCRALSGCENFTVGAVETQLAIGSAKWKQAVRGANPGVGVGSEHQMDVQAVPEPASRQPVSPNDGHDGDSPCRGEWWLPTHFGLADDLNQGGKPVAE
ncbi:MAG: hypothetical protein QFE16_17225 [Pseudomonadota bacterium]|nr:hypothetical protein [Pseudomonadota bacterium]